MKTTLHVSVSHLLRLMHQLWCLLDKESLACYPFSDDLQVRLLWNLTEISVISKYSCNIANWDQVIKMYLHLKQLYKLPVGYWTPLKVSRSKAPEGMPILTWICLNTGIIFGEPITAIWVSPCCTGREDLLSSWVLPVEYFIWGGLPGIFSEILLEPGKFFFSFFHYFFMFLFSLFFCTS